MSDRRCRPCTWDGRDYSSISEAAAALGITIQAMSLRLKRTRRKGRPPTPCTWEGVSYPSLAAAARANGVAPSTMCERIKRK